MCLAAKIKELKKEKDAVILSHYYTDALVQDISDYVGDSYYLSKIAAEVPQKTILFCGVRFMGESAKILSPEKKVLMADDNADCPMAHMVDPEAIQSTRAKYDDLAVVCYINSTAEVKAESDVCVTSSNAMKIVSKLPQKNILFVPDENLGSYIAAKFPEKNFIFHRGYCPVHQKIKEESVLLLKHRYPQAKTLAHPECQAGVLKLADFVGSTSAIIEYASQNKDQEFIVCTEQGILHELSKRNPGKAFYFPDEKPCCVDMKRITLEKINYVLKSMDHEVTMNEDLRKKAMISLKKMHELAE